MAENEREIKKSAFVVISCLYYELLHEKIFVVFRSPEPKAHR